MQGLEPYLPNIWLFIIGFFLLYYAATDGFDLGVGIISLFARSEEERGLMMGSLQSIWHDNQTWLVLLGGMLFGAFPLFYSLVLSSLYIPILVMLFGLMFRGVAFEFREHSPHKRLWGIAFGGGSLLTTLAQGFALGGLLSGLQIEGGRFTGSAWGWLNAYSMVAAVGVIFGYTMLGANYLIYKMAGNLQERSYRISLVTSLVTLGISLAVHAWTTFKYPHMAQKWGTAPEVYLVAFFPGLAGLAAILYFRSLLGRRELSPLLWNIAIILFSFMGLSLGMYPYMIPHVISPITVHGAAASPKTLLFMLVVTSILLPIILTYTLNKYRVFRGKLTGDGYGEEAQEKGV